MRRYYIFNDGSCGRFVIVYIPSLSRLRLSKQSFCEGAAADFAGITIVCGTRVAEDNPPCRSMRNFSAGVGAASSSMLLFAPGHLESQLHYFL
jgi:hypothetical protein